MFEEKRPQRNKFYARFFHHLFHHSHVTFMPSPLAREPNSRSRLFLLQPSTTPSNESSIDNEQLDDEGDSAEIADADVSEESFTRSTKQPPKKKQRESTKKDCDDEELRLIKQIADSASQSKTQIPQMNVTFLGSMSVVL